MMYPTLMAAAMFAGPAPAKTAPPAAPPPVILKTPSLARVVQYGARDTVTIQTQKLYTTIIILPEQEKIADFIIGDKNFWELKGFANMAWLKPAENKLKTNVHLVALSGNAYSFTVISDDALEPDYKIFLEPKDGEMQRAMKAPARFVEASAVSGLKEEIEQWRLEAFRLRKETEEKVTQAKAQAAAAAPAQAKHEYRFVANAKPFNIRAIWHDGRFTYIAAAPDELPALYELRDDKPNMVQFQFVSGLYTIDKVMENGYFQIGKQKTGFHRIK
jgi:type IV secretion system protein VirB9